MIVLLYLTAVIVTAIIVVRLLSRVSKRIRNYSGCAGLLVIAFIVFVLPLISNIFSFRLVESAPQLSRSASRDESIRRDVFVCDIEPLGLVTINDTLSMVIEGGWIERQWKQGVWYWSTVTDSSSNRHIFLNVREVRGEWALARKSRSSFGEALVIRENVFRGHIDQMPKGDSLSYYVLRKHDMSFDPVNVIGEINLILARPKLK